MLYFISECDIEYISPSNYKPPELQNKGTNGEVMDADDHYERLVRGSLKAIEKQKVKRNECLLIFMYKYGTRILFKKLHTVWIIQGVQDGLEYGLIIAWGYPKGHHSSFENLKTVIKSSISVLIKKKSTKVAK